MGTILSATGQILTRAVTFQFTLDPTLDQTALFLKCAGARRFTFNHHLGLMKDNLDVRALEREATLEAADMTPSLSWSAFSFINEFNAWKSGRLSTSPENGDGSRGLAWRHEIPESVFECASRDAAQALKNWSDARAGIRAGNGVGFPRFSSKVRCTPSFRLRNRAKMTATQSIRFSDASHVRLPKIGDVRVHGPTRQIRRMLSLGRFHIYSATLTLRGEKWTASLTGVAAQFHPARRSTKHRHQAPVGIDRGITSLAVGADADGQLVARFEGVRELRNAEQRLIMAQKALARTTPGSKGRMKAKARLNKQHRKVALTRKHLVHQASSHLVAHCAALVLEDLNVAGMARNRRLAKSVHDAAMGELRCQVEYKAAWYGTEVVIADRFFASSKTCSGCGALKSDLPLSTRTYACEYCCLEIDRDVNAAINLARWAPVATTGT
jgi:putative transposase